MNTCESCSESKSSKYTFICDNKNCQLILCDSCVKRLGSMCPKCEEGILRTSKSSFFSA